MLPLGLYERARLRSTDLGDLPNARLDLEEGQRLANDMGIVRLQDKLEEFRLAHSHVPVRKLES